MNGPKRIISAVSFVFMAALLAGCMGSPYNDGYRNYEPSYGGYYGGSTVVYRSGPRYNSRYYRDDRYYKGRHYRRGDNYNRPRQRPDDKPGERPVARPTPPQSETNVPQEALRRLMRSKQE